MQYAQAASLTIPNSFNPNTPAVAAQVNANFSAVETAVDDNDTRLTQLENLVTQLQNDLTAANATIAQIQNNTVLELDGLLQLSIIDGHETAEFTGVNIQLNNGTNSTFQLNGLGNLAIGYHPSFPSAPFFCSDSQYTDSVTCIGNLHTWAQNVRTGSHNLILGISQSYTSYSSILAGRFNIASGEESFVAGSENTASGANSSVLGGFRNTASGNRASVLGGSSNTANGLDSIVSGGAINQANGHSSTVSGGASNEASGTRSTVSGGLNRTAPGGHDWVAGSLFENQ